MWITAVAKRAVIGEKTDKVHLVHNVRDVGQEDGQVGDVLLAARYDDHLVRRRVGVCLVRVQHLQYSQMLKVRPLCPRIMKKILWGGALAYALCAFSTWEGWVMLTISSWTPHTTGQRHVERRCAEPAQQCTLAAASLPLLHVCHRNSSAAAAPYRGLTADAPEVLLRRQLPRRRRRPSSIAGRLPAPTAPCRHCGSSKCQRTDVGPALLVFE